MSFSSAAPSPWITASTHFCSAASTAAFTSALGSAALVRRGSISMPRMRFDKGFITQLCCHKQDPFRCVKMICTLTSFTFRSLSIMLLGSLMTAVAQTPRPTPPTRDPHTPGYVKAKELPDGANAPAKEDGNFILG